MSYLGARSVAFDGTLPALRSQWEDEEDEGWEDEPGDGDDWDDDWEDDEDDWEEFEEEFEDEDEPRPRRPAEDE